MRPIVNLPVVENLSPLPKAASTGCCVVGDPTGANPNLYFLFPGTPVSSTEFWRYNITSDTWQRLTNPFPVFGWSYTLGVATTMVYDVSRNAIWMFHADSNPPFGQLEYYSIALDLWTHITQAVGHTLQNAGLGGEFGTGAALAHPCTSISSGAASDDFLYVVGNNATVIYRFTVSTSWFTALTGAGAGRGGNAGAGCTFDWLPGRDPNWLIGARGGGSPAIDRYSISADAWANVGLGYPVTFDTGTSAVADIARNKLVFQPDGVSFSGGELYDFVPTTTGWVQLAALYAGNGTPHNGRSIVAYSAAGDHWIYVRKQTSTEFQRILLIE